MSKEGDSQQPSSQKCLVGWSPSLVLSDDEIEIKIKLLDNSTHKLRVRATDTISHVKEDIEKLLNIPADRQRLLFAGRFLRDESTLKDNQIEHDHAIHLIARPVPIPQNTEDEVQPPQSTHSVPPPAGSDHDEGSVISDLEVLQDILRHWSNLQITQQNQLRRRMQQRQQGYIYLKRERMREAIQQNTESIDVLLKTAIWNNSELTSTRYIEPFDIQKRELKIGQWIDVKDSVNQWLEAQVIKVNESEMKVYVHYNGWSARWDEWIDMKSDRIALFRTHTVQSQGCASMSPFPQNEIDGDKSEIPDRKSFEELIFSSCVMTNIVNQKLLQLVSLNNTIKYSNDYDEVDSTKRQRSLLSSQLAPVFDRIGRMHMDFGMLLGDLGSDSQKIWPDEDEDEEEKSQMEDPLDSQQAQAIDILSNRSNSSLGRYSNQQTEGTNFHPEREESQYSHSTRARTQELYRFAQPVMLNPGELHKINRPLRPESLHIQRIILPMNQQNNNNNNQNNNNNNNNNNQAAQGQPHSQQF